MGFFLWDPLKTSGRKTIHLPYIHMVKFMYPKYTVPPIRCFNQIWRPWNFTGSSPANKRQGLTFAVYGRKSSNKRIPVGPIGKEIYQYMGAGAGKSPIP